MAQAREIVPPHYESGPVTIPPNSPLPHIEEWDDEPTVKVRVPFGLRYSLRHLNWGVILGGLFLLAFWAGVAYLVYCLEG